MHKKTRKHTAILVPIILICCIAILLTFYNKTREYLRSICNAELADYATHNAYSTKCELEKAISLTQTACESFSTLDDFSSETAFQELTILKHDTPFETLTLCTRDGHKFDSSGGEEYPFSSDYFNRTLYGESNIMSVDTNHNGKLEIVVSSAIISNGKVKGTLHGTYSTFDLSKIINVDSFNGEGYAVLINSHGDIIIPSTSTDQINSKNENYLDFFKKVTFDNGSSYDSLLQNIKAKKSGLAVYSFGNEQRELYYTPIGINDWYLFQMVNTEVVNNYTTPMTKMVLILVFALSILFIFIGLFIHHEMKWNRAAKEKESERFRTLASNIPGGVAEILISDDFLIEYANDGFYELIGYKKEEFMHGWINGHCMRILYAEDSMLLAEQVRKQVEQKKSILLEYQIKTGDASIKWMRLSGKVIENTTNKLLIQALITDITTQKNETSALLENAKLDKMTQLYDKVSVTEIITNELRKPQSNTAADAILILDIDNFKHVNDTFGHPMGDVAIILIADTLKSTFRGTDLKGRIGGDEFIVFMRDISSVENTNRLIHIFLNKVQALPLAGHTGELSCSVGGVVVNSMKTYEFEDIFKAADANLYQIKKARKGEALITDFDNQKESKHD